MLYISLSIETAHAIWIKNSLIIIL